MQLLMTTDIVKSYIKEHYPNKKVLIIYLREYDQSTEFIKNFTAESLGYIYQDFAIVEFNHHNEKRLMRIYYDNKEPYMEIYENGEWVDENT